MVRWFLTYSMLLIFHLAFFFFQAEDGIRDLTVTGVQTCALPISKLAYATAQAAVVTAEANLQTAKDAMEDTQVRAPITGTILEIDAVLGTVISSPDRKSVV